MCHCLQDGDQSRRWKVITEQVAFKDSKTPLDQLWRVHWAAIFRSGLGLVKQEIGQGVDGNINGLASELVESLELAKEEGEEFVSEERGAHEWHEIPKDWNVPVVFDGNFCQLSFAILYCFFCVLVDVEEHFKELWKLPDAGFEWVFGGGAGLGYLCQIVQKLLLWGCHDWSGLTFE